MTLYTIVPEEIIFPHHHEKTANLIEMIYNGVHVMVEHDGGRTFRIDRIVSTDPEDYMNVHIQPGAVINMFEHMNH
ncbi:YlzJ-like family protein [Peribacillus frigoritolerans]|uniref:YlzJ-like family protein n=1 Tax=Peribacillus frigoritolerans TaxID=450367 RepID=UPI0025A0432D|nr:YlzJ-like family protein [Peribacillus frigoritolerans]MDM5309980.1 YlzJ-like family protein [Peribacillus frigoritolerans]